VEGPGATAAVADPNKNFVHEPEEWDVHVHTAGYAAEVRKSMSPDSGKAVGSRSDVSPLALQNNGNVLFGVAVGLLAHLFRRDVPPGVAFNGEVDTSGATPVAANLPPDLLQRARQSGVHTIVTNGAVKPADGDLPGGLCVRVARTMFEAVPIIWGELPPAPEQQQQRQQQQQQH
jgi:hypothetical protein